MSPWEPEPGVQTPLCMCEAPPSPLSCHLATEAPPPASAGGPRGAVISYVGAGETPSAAAGAQPSAGGKVSPPCCGPTLPFLHSCPCQVEGQYPEESKATFWDRAGFLQLPDPRPLGLRSGEGRRAQGGLSALLTFF